MFALGSPKAAGAVRLWREVEQDRKKGWKLLAALGLPGLLGLARLRTLDQTLEAMGRKLGLTLRAVEMRNPLAAVLTIAVSSAVVNASSTATGGAAWSAAQSSGNGRAMERKFIFADYRLRAARVNLRDDLASIGNFSATPSRAAAEKRYYPSKADLMRTPLTSFVRPLVFPALGQ